MEKRWIWPFELLEKIGQGGMGVMYRARYVKNDREVAVKLLSPEITDATLLARFEHEMEILKSLRHPNIVYCFGGKCEGDQRFYAMELVEGGSLSTLLEERGQLSGDQTIEFALQICAALSYAHDRGVIHRDIKSGNLLLTPAGRIKLSDFGLATIIAGHKLTAVGRTVGTFHYMAPEQIRDKPHPSPRTDLYALGCVLFELLTGRPPFLGETTAEILQRHITEPASRVSSLSIAAPAELDNLIARLLEKEPEHRPQTAAEVARELTTFRAMVSVVEHSPQKRLDAVNTKTTEPELRAGVRGMG